MQKRFKNKVVLTGGKFNRLHPGHEYLLKKCKSLGYLIVVIANDKHNTKPYAVPAATRKKNVEKLKIANRVVIGAPDNFADVIYHFKPDIIVLGYDQKLPDKETKKAVKTLGIEVVRCDQFGTY